MSVKSERIIPDTSDCPDHDDSFSSHKFNKTSLVHHESKLHNYSLVQQAIISDLCDINRIRAHAQNTSHPEQTKSETDDDNEFLFNESSSESFYSSDNDSESDYNATFDINDNANASTFLSELLSTNTVLKLEPVSVSDTPSASIIHPYMNRLMLPMNSDQCSPSPLPIKLEPNPLPPSVPEPSLIQRKRTRKHRTKRTTKKSLIECSLCDECFTTHLQFRQHMNTSHGIHKPYPCAECKTQSRDVRYATKAGLSAHIERDHEMVRNYKCTLCPKAFYRRATLEKHQRVHDGLKPYKCTHCEVRCSQKSSLRDHIIVVHMKQRNYKCVLCGRAFAASATMKSHMVAVHNDAKYARFECKECPKMFYKRGPFDKHLRIAHRPSHPIEEMIRRGHCPFIGCDKKYTSKNKAASVKYHLVTVHKDQRYANYECKSCDKLFYDKTSHTQHLNAKH